MPNADNAAVIGRLKRAVYHSVPWQLTTKLCPVLTYHGCFRSRPADVVESDSITPEDIYDHLTWLKRFFTFVTIDEFCVAGDRRGLAAVTFDDGYKSVLEEGLPVFESLNIPFTLFVNTASLEGQIFWRHKVVYLIRKNLCSEFAKASGRCQAMNGQGFYAHLKLPINDSRIVEKEIDSFFEQREERPEIGQYLADDPSYFRDHPLISYGNHSHHHYVLSSLPKDVQYQEIERAHTILSSIPHIRRTGVFALPFGERHHFNAHTVAAIKALKYSALLLNGRGMNQRHSLEVVDGLSVVKRFSPVGGPIADQLNREFVRAMVQQISSSL